MDRERFIQKIIAEEHMSDIKINTTGLIITVEILTKSTYVNG